MKTLYNRRIYFCFGKINKLYSLKHMYASIDVSKNLEKIAYSNISNPHFTVVEFAKMSCMSQSTLFRAVKRFYKCSPHEFLENIRFNKVSQLMQQKNLRVKEVAYEAGFADSIYFSAKFKQKYGYTPTQYKLQYFKN